MFAHFIVRFHFYSYGCNNYNIDSNTGMDEREERTPIRVLSQRRYRILCYFMCGLLANDGPKLCPTLIAQKVMMINKDLTLMSL